MMAGQIQTYLRERMPVWKGAHPGIEEMRVAADELRAELAGETVTFVVCRNINVSNICIVGCAFCGFGQGKRSPDAYEYDRAALEEKVRELRRRWEQLRAEAAAAANVQ